MNILTAGASRDLEENLKNFTSISERLMGGEFITTHHHAAFKELRDHHDAYTTLFRMLGLNLNYHLGGFYRVLEEDSEQISDRAKSSAVVALCLIEQIGNVGSDPTQYIDNQTVLSEDFLDKLLEDQTKHLKSMKLHHKDNFQKAINFMVKVGILGQSEESFNPGIKLYPAFHIYVDMCKKIASKPPTITDEANDSEETV